MLGAWAAATNEVSIEAIIHAFKQHFPGSLGEKNGRAAQMGYDFIRAGAKPVLVKKSEQTPGGVIKWERAEVAGAPGQKLHFASVVAARTSLAYPTGTWRYSRPVIDLPLCNGCGVCEMFCPDSCLTIVDKIAIVDFEFCKGCGICAQTCARHAVLMAIEEA
jgi:pyruvate ferredoxin oxidoreductase delta subunit